MSNTKPILVEVDPGLLAALEAFGDDTLLISKIPKKEFMRTFRYVPEDGGEAISYSDALACRLAHELLRDNDLAALKLKTLLLRMKECGLAQAYSRLMHGEKLDEEIALLP